MADTQHIMELVTEYRDAAEGTAHADAKEANRFATILLARYKELRDSAEGRNAITSLLTDSSPHVRCWAAAHSLFWCPEKAREVLEVLRDSDGPCAFDAKWTLKEFDKGKLIF